MDISFVLAQLDEAEELSELRRRVWETTYRGIYPDDMIDNFDYAFHNERNRLFIQSNHFVVCFITLGEMKIGYLVLQKKVPFHLLSLYLLKDYRRKGIGTEVFRFVRRYCAERGISEFDLDCHPDNLAALAFYQKMGGVITKYDIGYENNNENTVQLTFTV